MQSEPTPAEPTPRPLDEAHRAAIRAEEHSFILTMLKSTRADQLRGELRHPITIWMPHRPDSEELRVRREQTGRTVDWFNAQYPAERAVEIQEDDGGPGKPTATASSAVFAPTRLSVRQQERLILGAIFVILAAKLEERAMAGSMA